MKYLAWIIAIVFGGRWIYKGINYYNSGVTTSGIILVIIGIVLIALSIFFIVKDIRNKNRKSDDRDENYANDSNSANDSKENQEVTKSDINPNMETPEKVDYRAIHDEIYYVEYKLIPNFVEMYKDQPEKASQIVVTIYENLVTLQNNLRKVHPLAFGNISCEVCGDIETECLVVYQFPKPFDTPLAKYGAIYFNKLQQKYQYWTLEFSFNAKYVLGSMSSERHSNYGQIADLSKEEFIHEVCQKMNLDESILQQRNMISRKYMLELNDRNFKDVIENSPLLTVCFYDFNQPSQTMISILDQFAQEYNGRIVVGLYDVYGGHDNLSSTAYYSVSVLPTILFFADGEVINKQIGVCEKGALKAKFEELLAK